jgi:hypothetical protein
MWHHRFIADSGPVQLSSGAAESLPLGLTFPPWSNNLPLVAAIAGSAGAAFAIAGAWHAPGRQASPRPADARTTSRGQAGDRRPWANARALAARLRLNRAGHRFREAL